jgi:hypothetical protein
MHWMSVKLTDNFQKLRAFMAVPEKERKTLDKEIDMAEDDTEKGYRWETEYEKTWYKL